MIGCRDRSGDELRTRLAAAETERDDARRELGQCVELMTGAGVEPVPADWDCPDKVFAQVELLRQQRDDARAERDRLRAVLRETLAYIGHDGMRDTVRAALAEPTKGEGGRDG